MHKLTAENAGCWFDCARGQYIGQAVIEEAQSYGWDFEAAGYTEEDADPYGEHYHEEWDCAENFLNSICPDGLWIGGNENGDFGMWEVEEEA